MEGVNNKNENNTKEKTLQVIKSLIGPLLRYKWFLDTEKDAIIAPDEDIHGINREVLEVPDEIVDILKQRLVDEYNKDHSGILKDPLKKWEDVSDISYQIYGHDENRYLPIHDPEFISNFIKQLDKDELEKIISIADIKKASLVEAINYRNPFYESWDERINQDSVKKGFHLYLHFPFQNLIKEEDIRKENIAE